MTHVALTILAPIADGRHEALVAAITALPTGPGSPLARVPGLHVGRLTVIEALEDPRGPTAPPLGPFLLLSADADPPLDGTIAAIGTTCGPLLRLCAGCPDPADDRAFAAWVLAHRVRDGWTIMPYADRTLAEVRAALQLRARVGTFAATAPEAGADLRRRFLQEFGGAGA